MDHWRSLWTSMNWLHGGHYGPLDVTMDNEGQWSLWTSQRRPRRATATMGQRIPNGKTGSKPERRHGIYIPPQGQAEEHDTAPHRTTRARDGEADQHAAGQRSEAPAQRQARRGAVTSAGGFVPSNNFVIPTR